MRPKTLFSLSVLSFLGGVLAGDVLMGGMDIEMDIVGRLMPRQKSGTPTNLQSFTGALGGATADPILSSGDSSRPFKVGSATFNDFSTAFTRSCNNQHNECAEIANKDGGKGEITVPECDVQQSSCMAAVNQATATAFPTHFSSDANFDYFCDP